MKTLTHELSEVSLPYLGEEDDPEWQLLLQYLPPDLPTSAMKCGAFLKVRSGGIQGPEALLRLILATATGLSLDAVAARAVTLHLAEHLTDSNLSARFQKMVPWLGYLIGQQLAGSPAAYPLGVPLRLRLLDASTLQRPGSPGTDWRLHLGLDLQTGLIDHLSVTGDNIGEGLADLPVEPGHVVIGDRIYATRAGIAALTERAAYALVRMNWQNLPLQQRDGTPFDLWAALQTLPPGTQGVWEVATVPDQRDPGPARPAWWCRPCPRTKPRQPAVGCAGRSATRGRPSQPTR